MSDRSGSETEGEEAGVAETAVPAVAEVNDGQATGEPEAEQSQLAARLKAALFTAITNARDSVVHRELLDLGTLISLARSKGVKFEGDVNKGNLETFVKACFNQLGHDRKTIFLAMALMFAVAGQLALDEDELPSYVATEFDSPIDAYAGALEFLDKFLDVQDGEQVEHGDVKRFLDRQRTAEWKRALATASAVEHGAIRKLKLREGGAVELEETFPGASVVVHDKDGKFVGLFSTFKVADTTLGEDSNLRTRAVKPVGLSAYSFDFGALAKFAAGFKLDGGVENTFGDAIKYNGPQLIQTLVDKLFSQNEYPDRSVVDRAKVDYVVAVLPLPGDREEIMFRISFDGGNGPFEVEVIAGGQWYTAARTLVATEGGRVTTGIPSSVYGGGEEFFIAKSSGAMGAKQQATAGEVGEQSSKSVVMVAKPVVSAAKAAFRRALISYRKGNLSAEDFVKVLLDNSDPDSLLRLRELGWIDETQHIELKSLAMARESEKIFAPPVVKSFGGRGLGAALERKGSVAVGQGLHVTASGTDTGARYGRLHEKMEPCPMTPPKILVLNPVGVKFVEQDELDGIVDNVVQLASQRG